MNLSLGIFFGILALLGFGVADFLAAVASRKIGVLKTYFGAQLLLQSLLLIR